MFEFARFEEPGAERFMRDWEGKELYTNYKYVTFPDGEVVEDSKTEILSFLYQHWGKYEYMIADNVETSEDGETVTFNTGESVANNADDMVDYVWEMWEEQKENIYDYLEKGVVENG